MKKVSSKQAIINNQLTKYKSKLGNNCVICGKYGDTLMHLLPRSTYPEHIINPKNLAIGCIVCHEKYDNSLEFRQQQVKLYNKICTFDSVGAAKYFRIYG